MEFFLDTANINSIKKGIEYYPISGVTTNPTIISRERTNFIELLKNIKSILGNNKSLHVQVLGTNAKNMIDEAFYINELLGDNVYIKIPVIPEGIKAMKFLSEKNIKITATAVFTPQQGLIAAKSGAAYVAPYVNRIDNISGNGINVVNEMYKLFEAEKTQAKILAASFKNVEQIHKASLAGAHSATIPLELMEYLISHPLTDASVENFIKDWEDLYGKDKTLLP